MKIRKATEQDKKEAIKIAQELKEWFNKEGLKNMKTDFKLNNLIVAINKSKVSGFLCYPIIAGKCNLFGWEFKKAIKEKELVKNF